MIVRIIIVMMPLFLSCAPTGYGYIESDHIVTDYVSVKDFPESLKIDIETGVRPFSVEGDSYAAILERAIHIIDFRTKEKIQISEPIALKWGRSICLSERYVAWIAEKNINVYDRRSQQIRTLVRESAQPTRLALDKNRIVWSETWKEEGLYRNKWSINNTDIYAYDIESGREYAISVASGMQTNPSIHGDLVVWQDNRESPHKGTPKEGCGNCPENRFDIFLFDFKTLESRTIIRNRRLKSHPVVNAGRIVWEEYQERRETDIYGPQADLFIIDILSGKISRLTKTPDPETRPILIGNTLLWHVRTASDVIHLGSDGIEIRPATGIYVMEFASGKITRLSEFKAPRALFDGQRAIIIEWGFSASGRIYTLELD